MNDGWRSNWAGVGLRWLHSSLISVLKSTGWLICSRDLHYLILKPSSSSSIFHWGKLSLVPCGGCVWGFFDKRERERWRQQQDHSFETTFKVKLEELEAVSDSSLSTFKAIWIPTPKILHTHEILFTICKAAAETVLTLLFEWIRSRQDRLLWLLSRWVSPPLPPPHARTPSCKHPHPSFIVSSSSVSSSWKAVVATASVAAAVVMRLTRIWRWSWDADHLFRVKFIKITSFLLYRLSNSLEGEVMLFPCCAGGGLSGQQDDIDLWVSRHRVCRGRRHCDVLRELEQLRCALVHLRSCLRPE